jgi:hypothetical protein
VAVVAVVTEVVVVAVVPVVTVECHHDGNTKSIVPVQIGSLYISLEQASLLVSTLQSNCE